MAVGGLLLLAVVSRYYVAALLCWVTWEGGRETKAVRAVCFYLVWSDLVLWSCESQNVSCRWSAIQLVVGDDEVDKRRKHVRRRDRIAW